MNFKAIWVSFALVSILSASAVEFQGYQILESESDSKTLPTILVPPYKLYPTQIFLGQALIRDIINERFGAVLFKNLKFNWDNTKDLESNLRSLKKDELLSYVGEIQTRMNKTPYEGAFTPTGIFLFDGHHKCRALYEINQFLAKMTSDQSIRVFVPIKLVINYAQSGMNEKDIAKDIFINRSQAYVPDSLAGVKTGMDPVEASILKLTYLQKKAPHLGTLVDHPYRSIIGGVFSSIELDGNTFVYNFEFHLQELIKDKIDKAIGGRGVYPGMPLNDDLVTKVRRVIFSDKALLEKIAYWARIGNLTKEQAYERCVMLEKKDDKAQTSQEKNDEEICKGNKEKLLKSYQK